MESALFNFLRCTTPAWRSTPCCSLKQRWRAGQVPAVLREGRAAPACNCQAFPSSSAQGKFPSDQVLLAGLWTGTAPGSPAVAGSLVLDCRSASETCTAPQEDGGGCFRKPQPSVPQDGPGGTAHCRHCPAAASPACDPTGRILSPKEESKSRGGTREGAWVTGREALRSKATRPCPHLLPLAPCSPAPSPKAPKLTWKHSPAAYSGAGDRACGHLFPGYGCPRDGGASLAKVQATGGLEPKREAERDGLGWPCCPQVAAALPSLLLPLSSPAFLLYAL